MSKRRLDSVYEKRAPKSFSSTLWRFIREIKRRLEMSAGEGNGAYVADDMRVKKSAYPFPRKLGEEVAKAKKTIFQRR